MKGRTDCVYAGVFVSLNASGVEILSHDFFPVLLDWILFVSSIYPDDIFSI